MYRVFLSFCLSTLIVSSAAAQTTETRVKSVKRDRGACPKAYIGLNIGVNNPNGLFGISADIPVIKHFSAAAGIGRSTWGWKYFGEVRGYLGECHRGWAAGVGVSHNTGLRDFQAELGTTQGDKKVTLDLDPQTNAFVNLYHFFNLGKKRNRFSLMLGYSIPLESKSYKVKSGHVLNEDSKKAVETLAPGGVSIGIGFYFKVSSSVQ